MTATETGLTKLGMPKWGLSMTEGTLVNWTVDEGAEVQQGDGLVEVETEKINGTVEATASGVLLRRVAADGETVPVGGLLGVIGEASTPQEEVDAFVEAFQATFVPGEEEAEGGPSTETVEVGGRTLRYLRVGEGGEALILLHGFGGDLNNWLFNSQALGASRAVYALDLPGHGGTSKSVERGDLGEMAETLADFMDAVGVDGAHLVGHSMGGAVALSLALGQPDRVLSVTVIGSAGLGPEINEDYVQGFIAAKNRRELKPKIELLFAGGELVNRQMLDDVLKYKRLDGVDAALRAIADAQFPGGRQREVLAERLAESSVPLMAIWGRHDRIIPVSHAEALPAHARVEILEDQGHSPHMETAGEVNRLIEGFLSSRGDGSR
jgi:pyruvate dehydrogenase E2 component (dihydrolipoamide acetyltransferase)